MSIDRRYLLLGVAFLVLFYLFTVPGSSSVESYKAQVVVTDEKNVSAGISGDQGELDFGTASSRISTVRKELNFKNNGEEALELSLSSTGNISDSLTIKPERLTLSPGEEGKAEAIFHRANLSEGYYSGTVVVERRREGIFG